jgi:hypothetical protein
MDIINNNIDLKYLFERNTKIVQKKIIMTLIKKPSDADRVGWIYGFQSPKDTNSFDSFWVKIGRTVQNPFDRVEKQWGGELLFCTKSIYNHRLERLCHLFFDFCRQKRQGICDKTQKYIRPNVQSYVHEDDMENIYTHDIINTNNKTTTIQNSVHVPEQNNNNIFSGLINMFKSCLPNCIFSSYNHDFNEPINNNSNNTLNEKNNNKSNENNNRPSETIIVDKKIPNEIEWFHFEENINILKYISELNRLVEDYYNK